MDSGSGARPICDGLSVTSSAGVEPSPRSGDQLTVLPDKVQGGRDFSARVKIRQIWDLCGELSPEAVQHYTGPTWGRLGTFW